MSESHSKLPAENHPVWRLCNLLVVAGLISLFSFTNASNFDKTEIKMITEIIIAFGGYEIAKGMAASRKRKEHESTPPNS